MTDPATERRAIALFQQLLDIPEDQRDAWIAAQAGTDDRLLSRLNGLRAADRLASLRTGGATAALEEETPPERVGAYRIAELIGRGGMGSVYRGERATGDFHHAVAIKLIKPGLLSDALVERFQRERQTLAQLTHPNIAQLHDGGETEGGSPYIVMELVDGLPLLRFADERRLSRPERLKLFADVCSAVAFAHRNLVIHRDLTPSNVIVTRDGVAKLIDFGIAKPADPDGDDAFGGDSSTSGHASIVSLSLTPGYAAPERMTGARATTATDIYSLGKMLERLVPLGPRDDELAAIVAQAAADAPADRYPTVEALADDIARLQDGRPVAAIHGGQRYRIRKFLTRYRLPAAAAAFALVALVVALIVSLAAYSRAEAARKAEAARFAELRSLAGYMLFDLNGALRRVIGNVEPRVGLAARAQRYLSALADSSTADPALKLEAARGFIALAGIQGVPTEPNLGQAAAARASLTRAIALLDASGAPSARLAPLRGRALADLAMVQAHIDHDPKAATATLRRAAAAIGAAPPDTRDAAWLSARSNVRRAQLDITVLDADPAAMGRLADQLVAEIDDWPVAARTGYAAAFDRAYADHYQGLRRNFTDELPAAMPFLERAQRRFEALDRARPNDPLVLYMIAFNAYVGYGTADGIDPTTSLRFLRTARAASDRLVALEPRDHTISEFAVKVKGAEAQSLSSRGQHAAALALQRENLAYYVASAGRTREDRGRNQIATAYIILGNIAVRAAARPLACDSHAKARTELTELTRTGKAMKFVANYTAGLERNLAKCASGGALEVLEGN